MHFFYLTFLITLLSYNIAFAHQPYLEKQGYIHDYTLIKETLSGDGIFAKNPMRFQIRNLDGEVLAYSRTASHITSFCFSTQFCWVFSYDFINPFIAGYYLDYKNLKPQETKIKEEDLVSFDQYLKNKNIKRFTSYSLGYPEHTNDLPAGFRSYPLTKFLSPVVIIIDQYIPVLFFAFSTFLLHYFGYILFSKHKPNHHKKHIIFLKYFSRIALILVSLGIYGVIAFILTFTFSTPLICMVLAVFLGELSIKKITKNPL